MYKDVNIIRGSRINRKKWLSFASVFSNRHVVGRVVRPADGHIVASASTLEDRTRIARRKIGDEENNNSISSSTDDDENKRQPNRTKSRGKRKTRVDVG